MMIYKFVCFIIHYHLYKSMSACVIVKNIIGEVPDNMKSGMESDGPPFPVVFFCLTLVETKDS